MSKLSFFLTLAFIVTNASAQDQSQIDAAKELMELMNLDQVIQQSYDQTLPRLAGMADQMGLTEEERPTFEKYMEKMVVAMKEEMSWEKMEPHVLKAYVEVYTEEELRELSAFYASPIGQKFITKMPELMQATMRMTQEMMQDFMPRMQEIQKEMQAELQQQRSGPD